MNFGKPSSKESVGLTLHEVPKLEEILCVCVCVCVCVCIRDRIERGDEKEKGRNEEE